MTSVYIVIEDKNKSIKTNSFFALFCYYQLSQYSSIDFMSYIAYRHIPSKHNEKLLFHVSRHVVWIKPKTPSFFALRIYSINSSLNFIAPVEQSFFWHTCGKTKYRTNHLFSTQCLHVSTTRSKMKASNLLFWSLVVGRRHIHTKVSFDRSVLHDRVLFRLNHTIYCMAFI